MQAKTDAVAESEDEMRPGAPSPDTVCSHARCLRCRYDLHGLSSTGVCPECGTAVASSLRDMSLASADRAWVLALLIGVRMLLIGFASVVALFVFFVLASESISQDADITRAVFGLCVLFLTGWFAFGAMLLSKPEPSRAGEREYGIARKIARVAIVLGALQAVYDCWVICFLSPQMSRLIEVTVVETLLAQIIGVVGVFAHLQYLEKLILRIPQLNPAFARFLKFAITGAWAALYMFSVVGLLSIWQRSVLPHAYSLFAMLDLLFGGFCGLCYLVFLVTLERALADVVRNAAHALAQPQP